MYFYKMIDVKDVYKTYRQMLNKNTNVIILVIRSAFPDLH